MNATTYADAIRSEYLATRDAFAANVLADALADAGKSDGQIAGELAALKTFARLRRDLRKVGSWK
jgi:hypothetical protein